MAAYMCYGAIGRQNTYPRKEALSKDGMVIDVTPGPGRTFTKETYPPRGRGRGESIMSPRRIRARLRAAEAIRLRMAGATWQTIATTLGYSDPTGPWLAVRRTCSRMDWDALKHAELKKQR